MTNPIYHHAENGKSVTQMIDENSKQDTQFFSLNELDKSRITNFSQIPQIEPMIKVDDSILATKGDIAFVAGLPKAGKSSIAVFILYTTLIKEIPPTVDTLKIRSQYADNKPVIYIDTEQPIQYTNKLQKTVCNMLGVEKTPQNLHIYNFRKYSNKDKLHALRSLMKHYPETHLWIIDGIADLVSDPNNAEESFALINEMMAKAEELHTAIVLYLHLNSGQSDKLRGHLGSEADRKCGGSITIKKKDGIHSITPRMIRGSSEFEPIYFGWNTETNRMAQLNDAETENARRKLDKEFGKRELRKQMAIACFNTNSPIKRTELHKRVKSHSFTIEGCSISDSTVKSRIKDMLDEGFIFKTENGNYNLHENLRN